MYFSLFEEQQDEKRAPSGIHLDATAKDESYAELESTKPKYNNNVGRRREGKMTDFRILFSIMLYLFLCYSPFVIVIYNLLHSIQLAEFPSQEGSVFTFCCFFT